MHSVEHSHIIKKYIKLRWRFEYEGGEVRAGLWDNAGERPREKWNYQPSNGLLKVGVEAVDKSGVAYVVTEVPAHDFKKFQYHAIAIVPGVLGLLGAVKIGPTITGMSIYTVSGKIITIYCDATHTIKNIREPE